LFTRWRDKSVGDFGRSGSGSGGLPAGIEDLELSFRVRAGRSSASSSPAEGAGGGGEEERWREGEEGGVEERTGWEADLVCKGWRREVDKEGFGGLAGEVGRDKGDNGGGACSGIVWFTTPPPTPPRPSSLRGIELLEPCSDLQPLNPLLDPCDSELSGLLGVPLPTLERDGESGGAGGGGGLASSAASRNTS